MCSFLHAKFASQECGLQSKQALGVDHRRQRPQSEVLGLAQPLAPCEDPRWPQSLGVECQVQPSPWPAGSQVCNCFVCLPLLTLVCLLCWICELSWQYVESFWNTSRFLFLIAVNTVLKCLCVLFCLLTSVAAVTIWWTCGALRAARLLPGWVRKTTPTILPMSRWVYVYCIFVCIGIPLPKRFRVSEGQRGRWSECQSSITNSIVVHCRVGLFQLFPVSSVLNPFSPLSPTFSLLNLIFRCVAWTSTKKVCTK